MFRIRLPIPRAAVVAAAMLAALHAVAGCSDPDNKNGRGDGSAADAGLDGQPVDARPVPDIGDIGDDFAIVVPPGAAICAVFGTNGSQAGEVKQEWEQQARISFKEGVIRLSRTAATTSADLVARLEHGPDATVLQPQGSGSFTRTLNGTPDDGTHAFAFSQSFGAGTHSYSLRWTLSFEVKGGVATQPIVTLDPAYASRVAAPAFEFFGALQSGTQKQERSFYACAPPEGMSAPLTVTGTAKSGETFRFEGRMIVAGIMKITPVQVKQASFSRGSENRSATNYFKMVYDAGWHNWDQKILVVFDAPVGTTHGFVTEEVGDKPPNKIVFLDAALQPNGESELTDYKVQRP